MIVLDENIIASQREALRSGRIRAQQIGFDIARNGIKDTDILPFLRRRARVTFFTRDLGLYSRHFCHPRYGLVILAVGKTEVASFARRVLRHPRFQRTQDRMGRVVQATHAGLRLWTVHSTIEEIVPWRVR